MEKKEATDMKKKWIAALLLVLTMLLLTGCDHGNADFVTRQISESERFSQKEQSSAMDAVCKQFEKGFPGCYLLKLWYDEEETLRETASRGLPEGEVMVLTSHFWVDGSGKNPVLNPASFYQNWKWILVREGGKWKVDDWGYA